MNVCVQVIVMVGSPAGKFKDYSLNFYLTNNSCKGVAKRSNKYLFEIPFHLRDLNFRYLRGHHAILNLLDPQIITSLESVSCRH